MLITLLLSVIYCAAAVLVYFYMDNLDSQQKTINARIVAVVVALAVVVRVVPALQDYYFTYDINCFKAWGSYANGLGFKNLYGGEYFLDYPPGYIYVLALTDAVVNLLNLGSTGCTFAYKLPAMVADFGLAYLLFRFAKLNNLSRNKSLFAAGLLLFMPQVIFNSAVWGQIESWYILFVLLGLCFAHQNKTVPAAVAYGVAFITKPQAIMFGPLFLFYVLRRKSLKEFFKAVGTGAATVYLLALPFCKNLLDIRWLVRLYVNTVGGYQYFTVNAFNLHYLAKLNWTPLPDNTLAGFINPAVIAISLIVAAFVMLCNKKFDGFFAAGGVIVAFIFGFCTMMHERYLWPAAVMCLFAYATSRRKGWLMLGGVLGCLCYINSSWVMAMYYQTFDLSPVCERIVSFAVVASVLAVGIYAIICAAKETTFTLKNIKKFITPKYITITVTALYSLVAFFNLGSTKAPQTFYTVTGDDYLFTVEFDNPVQLGSIYTYSGIGNQFSQPEGQKILGSFEISLSENGTDFDVVCDIEGLSVYTWRETLVNADSSVKAVRVRGKFINNVLYEIAFFDTAGNLLQGRLIAMDSDNPYGAQFAYDEQDTVPADTSYFGSMYFDEIYHGRTAFEQLKGYDIYETTHPPLGKILISIGIALFGMTPFGWRVVGAVCGIVMLPVIYLLVDSLCKNKWAACLAASLMALDFMHLAQTRIATVDTYVVLFVLLTFLFMSRWHNAPWGSAKGWLQLAVSGVFMGCAIASKWNGAYPMVALAVLFFISLASKYKNSDRTKADNGYLFKTLALCCVFFVAVPAVIYTASFIPVIHAENLADYFRQLVSYQKHMYNYHANLVAEHYFSSMWYSWPLCLKPIWYAITESATTASSISAFGNPAIWPLTVPCAVYCLYQGVRHKKMPHLFACLGWLSAYLPWVMVTRLCFIYHYFPCAVFGIVAIALTFADICTNRPAFKKAVVLYLALCLVLFVMFLPVTTGFAVSKEYLDFLEFMPEWHFINL